MIEHIYYFREHFNLLLLNVSFHNLPYYLMWVSKERAGHRQIKCSG